ncbi:MAG: Type 1 glutamine amidotransferase-like domain-containing protein, partial [Candidatus Dormiibacterota bacterium]
GQAPGLDRRPSLNVPTGRRTLLLLGGNEWRHGSEAADAWWLGRASRPHVTVVTSAAQDIPDTQVGWAASYFGEMGGTVDGCRIQTREDAAEPYLLEQLAGAAAIYLCGGDPAAARRVLAGSQAAEALRSAYRRGIPLAGSSAGAMVLSRACLLPGQDFQLAEGIGLFGAVVVPHWSGAERRWTKMAAQLGREREVIGIDESTGVCWDGREWVVRGPGRAVVVTASGEFEVGEGRPAPPVE